MKISEQPNGSAIRNRLVSLLARGVRGFFAWNTRVLVGLTLWRVGALRRRGDWKKAADEMVAVVGLEAADFVDPGRALAKIRHRLADVNPETALLFFMQMTTFLVDDKKQNWVAAVHELDAGLKPGDYSDLERVAARLKERTGNLSPMIRFVYGFRLANVLGLAERSNDELAVLEAHLGLRQQDYQNRDRLRALLAARPEIQPDLWAGTIQMLAAALGKVGRITESVAVLNAALGLSASDYTEPRNLQAKINTVVGPLESRIGSALLYVTLLAKALRDSGRVPESIALFEAEFGLDSTDYRDVACLRAKIRTRTEWLPPEMQSFFAEMFFSALTSAHRFEDSVAVLGADLECDLTRLDGETLAVKLRARCELLPGNLTGIYLGSAAYTLAMAGRPREAAAVLAADSDLAGLEWQNIHFLAERLNDRLGDLTASTRLMYVGMLVSALQIAGQEGQAALLSDSYLRIVSPIGKEPPDPSLMAMTCELYADWMRWWGQNAERKPLEVCRGLVPYLRQTIAEQGVVLVDRERFIRGVSDLRKRIVQTGLYWVEREIDPEKAKRARYEVLLWDLELAQRLLTERFLLTDIRRVEATAPPPAGRWPWRGRKGPKEPKTRDYLPPVDEPEALAGVLGEISAPSPSLGTSEQIVPEARQGHPYERLGNFAGRGVDEASLAEGLGSGGVLLRATFDPDGRLAWNALASDGARLTIAAHGFGSSGDLERLRWAAAFHDFRIGFMHWHQAVKPFEGVREAGCRELLKAIRSTRSVEGIPESMRESVGHLLRLLIWPDSDLNSASAVEPLRSAADLVISSVETPLRRDLDGATVAFLEQVAGVWDLAPLAAVLESGTDLVVQVDDALHAVPIAWLPVGGEPLYRRVRSVRASLAPALDLLMGDLEREVRTSGPRPRRMLSISSFEWDDPARPGGRWLHHGQLRIAEAQAQVYECFAGADREGGTVGAIRGALDLHGRFETAAVCGHGDFERMGIVLSCADGGPLLWQGDGCDLGGIEWLLLVSCSIGRAQQTGDLDVEGFCVQLSAHRARSVLACRWPVLSVQAAAFANEAVHQYMKLIAKEPQDGPCRARALNQARLRFSHEEDGDRPLVGMNTAAAFELYGLG